MRRDEGDALLSVAQAATLLGVHPNTIRAWTEAGRLPAFRINARGDRRFRRDDVARLLVEDGSDGGEMAIFARIASGFASSPTAAGAARAVVQALRSELDASRAAVYLIENDHLARAAHAGFAAPPPSRRPHPTEERVDHGADVELALRVRGHLVGSILLERRVLSTVSPPFVPALLGTVAAAVAGARLLDRSRREVKRARALRSVTKELVGELDLVRVLDDIIDRTRTLFGADRAGLWMFEGTPHPVPLVTRGLSERFVERSTMLTRTSEAIGLTAIRERAPQWMRDAHLDPAGGEMRVAYAEEGIRTVCLIPLPDKHGAIGVIGLYDDTDRIWPEEEIALVQAFADQAAVAIQNARLYRSLADQAARLRSIQDLSARLNRLTDVRAIAEAIVAEASTLAEYHDIRVYQVDWERRMCDAIAFTHEMLEGSTDDAEALLRVQVGEGFTGWVAETGEPLLINDALDDERGKTIEGTDDVPESMLLVPMLYEGRTLGVIVLSQLGFNRFSTDDLQTMSIFAGYAAQAMANATSYERMVGQSNELARLADSQRRLLEINERLLATLDQAGVLATIADGMRDVVAYDNLSIFRSDPVRQVMYPVLTREHHAEEVGRYVIPFGQGLMGWAVEHGEPVLANDAVNDPRAVQIPGTPAEPEAVVVVPLMAGGDVLGALNVSRVGGEEVHFSKGDFELVQLFAAQASIALRNAEAHQAMSQRAETDALTGLGNHGAFQRDLGLHLEEAAAAATAAEGSFSVLMMDLDCFKAYNDRHGHPAGDALLHLAATTIYGAARTDDHVYRYGGDEFALILPGTSGADAARAAERIRRAVARLTADEPTPVTITVGVAGFPDDATDRPGLIAAADTALYYGKRAGEDRVVRADELTPDVGQLRGTLEELAAAALRGGDDEHAVEHLVERATHVAAPYHDDETAMRDALLTIARSFDTDGLANRGHADRVGRLAASVAARMRLPLPEQGYVELAARLHALDERGGADLSALPSLGTVSGLIAGARALVVTGARRGHRATRARGPAGRHIVAAVTAYDRLVSGGGGGRVGRAEAIEELRLDPATFRADVLEALAESVEHHPDAGRRRRQSDSSREVRGAA